MWRPTPSASLLRPRVWSCRPRQQAPPPTSVVPSSWRRPSFDSPILAEDVHAGIDVLSAGFDRNKGLEPRLSSITLTSVAQLVALAGVAARNRPVARTQAPAPAKRVCRWNSASSGVQTERQSGPFQLDSRFPALQQCADCRMEKLNEPTHLRRRFSVRSKLRQA
jgi:hypothetical protein